MSIKEHLVRPSPEAQVVLEEATVAGTQHRWVEYLLQHPERRTFSMKEMRKILKLPEEVPQIWRDRLVFVRKQKKVTPILDLCIRALIVSVVVLSIFYWVAQFLNASLS